MKPILDAVQLTKIYGSYRAVDDLTLSIAPGEIVGLLGPNGSGKTTALRCALGFLRPTSGSVRIAGFDCWHHSVEARTQVSYLPGELRLYESMTGRQLISFLSQLRQQIPNDTIDALARRLDIDPDKPLTQMSSGMKRKIALMAVLIPEVPLIILDEPTNTLDPNMRDEFLEQLRLAKASGKAILFSSHVLSEVEAVCDRVAILRRGKLVHLQAMDDLRSAYRVVGRLAQEIPTQGPDGTPLGSKQDFDIEYRGPLDHLTRWLAHQSLAQVKVEPLGLTKIYRHFHANGD